MSDLKIPKKGGEEEDVFDIPLPFSWHLVENYPTALILLSFWLKSIPNFLPLFKPYFSFCLKS